MLTGRSPMLGADGKLVPATAANPRLPRRVNAVLQQALATQKGRRYPTAGAFAAALTKALRVPRGAQAREQALLPMGNPWPRRTVLVLAIVALFGGCAYIASQIDWSPPSPIVVTATPMMTRTRAPTRTPTPSRTRPATETPVPTLGETSLPATQAPRTAPAPPTTEASSRTPKPTLEPAPALLSPAMGAQLGSSSLSFSWEWWRGLGAFEHYDVRLWRQGEPRNGVAWVDAPRLTMPKPASGVYFWSVTVVREIGTLPDGSRAWEPVSEESVVRSFAYYSRGGSSGSPEPTPTY